MKTNHKKLTTAALCLTGLSFLAACGEDGRDAPNDSQEPVQTDKDGSIGEAPRGDAGTQQPSGNEDGAVSEGPPPVYAIATQVFGANDTSSYLVIREGDLFAGTVGLSGSGIVGRGLVAAGPAAGSAYYASDKSPEVARYEVTQGKATKKDSVSFGGRGVTSISEYAGQLVFVSETKALYFDWRTLNVILWNPKEMTVTGTIDVTGLKIDSFNVAFSTVTVRKGDKVYMPVAYRTPTAVPHNSAMLVIDTSNDSAKIVKETRCGYVRDIAEGADGKLYVATEAFGAAVNHLNSSLAPKPCLLRFDPGVDEFDASYFVDLNALTGTTTGSLIKLPNGKAYVRTLDTAKANTAPSPRHLASALAWGWSEITLEDEPQVTPVPDAHVMGGSLVPFELGDKLVIPEFASDQSKTQLCDMTNGPTCTTKVEVKGLVFSVAKLN